MIFNKKARKGNFFADTGKKLITGGLKTNFDLRRFFHPDDLICRNADKHRDEHVGKCVA